MPREYITRLVFDRSAQGLAIVQRGLKVVGGIAYRPFPQRHFAEIVFFAISGVYQVNVSVTHPILVITSSHLPLTDRNVILGLRCSLDESFQDAYPK
jgi:hypothetical protein